ncbi:MAG: hypothetical protein WBX25_21375 [Rhodomicrobium sp.]
MKRYYRRGPSKAERPGKRNDGPDILPWLFENGIAIAERREAA